MDFNEIKFIYRQSSALGDSLLVPAIESAGTGGFAMILELISLFTDTPPEQVMNEIQLHYWKEFRAGTSDYAIVYHSSANDEHTAAVLVSDSFDKAFNFLPQGEGEQAIMYMSLRGKWNADSISDAAKIDSELNRKMNALDDTDDSFWDDFEALLNEVDGEPEDI